VVDQVMVGERRLDVGGAVEHPRRSGANRALVHRHGFARTGPLQLHQVGDHPIPVRPVGLLDREAGGDLLVHRRQIRAVPVREARRDQAERGNPIWVVEGDDLGDRATHGHPDEVGALQAERVEHPERIVDQVTARISGLTRGVMHRPARIAMVVADHEPRSGGQALAEPDLPPVHRRAGAHDQEDRRVAPLAEGLGAELDVVGMKDQFTAQLDHLLRTLGESSFQSI
jgi:hypothetical protein